MPDAEELYDCLIDRFGGPEGLADVYHAMIIGSRPGSVVAGQLLNGLVKLTRYVDERREQQDKELSARVTGMSPRELKEALRKHLVEGLHDEEWRNTVIEELKRLGLDVQPAALMLPGKSTGNGEAGPAGPSDS